MTLKHTRWHRLATRQPVRRPYARLVAAKESIRQSCLIKVYLDTSP